jgi:hypothetical protein
MINSVKLPFPAILMLLLLVESFVSPPAWAERSPAYYSGIVQTLLDSEKGIQSKKPQKFSFETIKKYLLIESSHKKTYAKTFSGSTNPPRGVYRITVGTKTWKNLNNEWWKRLTARDKSMGGEIWYRTVTIDQKKYLEMLARRRSEEIILEIRSLCADLPSGRQQIRDRFALFWKNARQNKLFESEVKEKPIIEKPLDLRGIWAGPMENSRGGKATTNLNITKAVDGGEVTGLWHAGWKLENGRRAGNILTWEHTKIANGCRDYRIRMEIADDEKNASLIYWVKDRCRKPGTYTGSADLARKK